MRPDQLFSLAVLVILLGLVAVALSRIEVPPRSSDMAARRMTGPRPAPAVPPAPPTTQPTAPAPISPQQPLQRHYEVTEIVDGDTIKVAGLGSIRLLGIDTPELTSRKGVQCLAQEAAQRMDELLVERVVILERDIEDRDRYRRLLRYAYLPDGAFVNRELVLEGYAKLLTIPPNVRHFDELFAAQQEARQDQRGLWNPQACPKN